MKDNRILRKIEMYGNKIPHPFWIFNVLIILLLLMSYIFSYEVFYPTTMETEVKSVNNLLEIRYLLGLLGKLDEVFLYFRPLSIVILILMGVSVFQSSGAISAIIRSSSKRIPVKLIVVFAAFIGVNANIASDVSVILIPTVFAAMFQSLNINPWIGIIVGYATVNGAWSLNMFIAGTDAITSEITNITLNQLGLIHEINPFSNWVFMFTGSILIIILTVLVTDRITKKTLKIHESLIEVPSLAYHQLSSGEKRGMKYLKYFTLVFTILIIGFFQLDNPNHNWIYFDFSLYFENIVGLIFIFFVLAGLSFGLGSGSISSLNDLPNILSKGISGASVFIVTALPASIFIKMLNDSNIGEWIGYKISVALINLNLPPLIVLLLFIVFVALFNLFLVSGSVKWLILAPVIIPMFTQLDIQPELVQLAYRIGDSVTNCITPVDVYLSVMINLLLLYRPDQDTRVGIGTVVSLTLPYSVAYFIGLTMLFTLFYIFNIRIGF